MNGEQRAEAAEVGREVYFFGCIGRPGHYLWSAKPRKGHLDGGTTPWGYIDGHLTPTGTRQQGAAALHVLDGWTAVAFWDYTVDKRPGSNGAFVVHDVLDFDEVLAVAKLHFPDVIKRVGRIRPDEDGTR